MVADTKQYRFRISSEIERNALVVQLVLMGRDPHEWDGCVVVVRLTAEERKALGELEEV